METPDDFVEILPGHAMRFMPTRRQIRDCCARIRVWKLIADRTGSAPWEVIWPGEPQVFYDRYGEARVSPAEATCPHVPPVCNAPAANRRPGA